MKKIRGKFSIFVQLPHPKAKGAGSLSIDREGNAHFFSEYKEHGNRCIADMIRAKIDFAGADGIMVSGFEPCGFKKNGELKYKYQEWWLRYNVDDIS